MVRPVLAVAMLVSVLGLGAAASAAAGAPGITSDLGAERAAEVQSALERLGPVDEEDPTIATIDIPAVGVSGPIMEGVDDVTIRRAIGHFPGTALPFEDGNMALAAHRTTHFRGLRDIRIGDEVVIHSQRGDEVYRVERTWVVDPEEVWVLDPTERPSLTLVTCYPFDFHGHAPRRFVVRAVEVGSADGS